MSGFGCQDDCPPASIAALTASGSPIAPSSISAARRLVRPGQEDVGRAAEPQAAPLGLGHELGGLGDRQVERLLGVDVLAGGERLADDGAVHARRRQVEHDVDRRVGQQLVDRRGREPVLLGQRARRARVDVGAGDDPNASKAGALRAYSRLMTPQPTMPTFTPPPAGRGARRASGAAASSVEPSASSCSTSSHSAPADGRRQDARRSRRPLADAGRTTRRPVREVLDVHQRDATARRVSTHRVDAGPPDPAEVELQERSSSSRSRKRGRLERADLGVVVVEPELQAGAGRAGRPRQAREHRSASSRSWAARSRRRSAGACRATRDSAASAAGRPPGRRARRGARPPRARARRATRAPRRGACPCRSKSSTPS